MAFFRRLKQRRGASGVQDGLSKDTKRRPGKPQKLQKRNAGSFVDESRQEGINELGERDYSVWSETSTLVEPRSRDHTDMLHGLAHHDSFDSLVDGTYSDLRGQEELDDEESRRLREICQRKQALIRRVPSSVWRLVADTLDPADAAHLAVASKSLLAKLGNGPLHVLALPENRQHRIRFLNHLNEQLPSHLLCFPCGTYHRRTSIGNERPKADFVSHPLYDCPLVFSSYLPRMRLAFGRELPYSFVQLATRYAHSKRHGVHPDALSQRWKDALSGWSHQSRYIVHDGHLLMRIRSQVFAPPKLTPTAERHLLYDREEYMPFFSVCAHWRDGDLMSITKCALSHVPEAPQSYMQQLKKGPAVSRTLHHPNFIVRGCDDCRPARRCPECPTEYLVEISMVEDKHDPVTRFKHALVVTRWSDLGDGSSPTASPEYCAINGIKADYQSFSHVGRRAVAGIMESKISGCIPGQRIISLNPKNKKLGESGHGWY